MKLPYTLLIACAAFLPASTLYGLDGWMTDLDKAKIQAEKQKKDLFILYKGSSWNPEQYGTPESMFTCNSVKESLGRRFILVMQDYPPDYQEDKPVFSFNLSFPSKPSSPGEGNVQTQTRCVFATDAAIPYHISTLNSTWLQLCAEGTEAEKKKNKALKLIHKIQATKGEEKYRLMGKLFSLTGWSFNLPAALYPQMREEALLYDRNNLSKIRNKDTNYLRLMQELAWRSVCVSQSQEFIFSSDDDLPEIMIPSLSREWEQKMRFLKLFYIQGSPLLEKEPTDEELGSLDHLLDIVAKKTEQIISLAPSTKESWMMRIKSRTLFSQIYYLASLRRIKSQPDKVLEMLPDIVNQPWADEEAKQIFGLLEATCYFKMGNLDTGLDLLKTYRDIAPWTKNAKNMDDALRSITPQILSLQELWKKKQTGDREAAEVYENNTRVFIDLEAYL